jgi:hypothetical protein
METKTHQHTGFPVVFQENWDVNQPKRLRRLRRLRRLLLLLHRPSRQLSGRRMVLASSNHTILMAMIAVHRIHRAMALVILHSIQPRNLFYRLRPIQGAVADIMTYARGRGKLVVDWIRVERALDERGDKKSIRWLFQCGNSSILCYISIAMHFGLS